MAFTEPLTDKEHGPHAVKGERSPRTIDSGVLRSDLFFNLSLGNLKKYCSDHEFSDVHGATIFRAVYKQGKSSFDHLASLPEALKLKLKKNFHIEALPTVLETKSEGDDSVKFVFALTDGAQIEAVLMPETNRLTLCISSQVGCAQGCIFCHTGRMGLKRSLTRGEMVAQVWTVNGWIASHPKWLQDCGLKEGLAVTNIVYMGMGEPLDNVEETIGALEIFCEPFGLNLTKRRISVSTAGHLDGLDRILRQHPDVRLAISIHHPDDRERSRIMPINRRWPLPTLMARLRAHPWPKGVSLLIQYTLIGQTNDGLDHAARLVELLRGLPVKINLIPWNPVENSALVEPTDAQLFAFRDFLHRAGLRVMVRFSKGRDIRAACGQLVTRSAKRASFMLPDR